MNISTSLDTYIFTCMIIKSDSDGREESGDEGMAGGWSEFQFGWTSFLLRVPMDTTAIVLFLVLSTLFTHGDRVAPMRGFQ